MTNSITYKVAGLRIRSYTLWLVLILVLGCLIGISVATGKYFPLEAISFIYLFIVPVFAVLILSFFAIQISPTEYFKIASISSLDFYLWDILILFLVVNLVCSLLLRKKKWVSTPLNPWIYALFAWGFLSVIYSYSFGQEHFQFTLVSFLRTISFTLLFFFVIHYITTREKIETFTKIVIILAIFQVTLAIVQRMGAFTGFFLPMQIFSPVKGAYGSIDFRSAGTIGAVGLFSQAMLLFAFPAVMIIYAKKRSYKGWFLFFFTLIGIILSGSKAAYLGVAVLVLFLLLQTKTGDRIGMLFKLIIPSGIILYFFWDYISHRLLSEFLAFDISNREFLFDPGSSIISRLDIWQDKYSLFALSPIFGHGWSGSFLASNGIFGDSHNQYIETLVDLGIPGLLIFLGLLCYILYLTWGLRKMTGDHFFISMSVALFASFIGFYVSMLFLVTLETGNSATGIFWALVGLVMSARRIAQKEKATLQEVSLVGNKTCR